MPLSSDPSVTYNSQGNVVAAGTALANGATTGGVTVDVSANSLGTKLSVTVTFGGTVTAGTGVQVSCFPAGDSTPHFDTSTTFSFQIAAIASQTKQGTIELPTGKYSVVLQNLDGSNPVTYGITSNPIA